MEDFIENANILQDASFGVYCTFSTLRNDPINSKLIRFTHSAKRADLLFSIEFIRATLSESTELHLDSHPNSSLSP